MTIHNPPLYRYALYESWDREAFELIKETAKNKDFPKILGNKEDKNRFLISLIRTQKALHDWRDLLVDVLAQVKQRGEIDTIALNKKYPLENISKEKPAWVTYREDQTVSDFIDELAERKIDFVGTDEEISEFVMRFVLGQLSHDWEWTIMMVWEMLGDGKSLKVKEINHEMQNFDYAKLFTTKD